MNNFSKIILTATLGVATTSHAAVDGTIGATSSGESDITLTKQNAVLISGISDLDLGSFISTSTDLEAFDDVCIFNSTSNYRITVTSANSAFALSDGGTGTIPYAMTWADSTSTANNVAYNAAMPGLQGDTSSTSCGGGTNARFTISVAAADFNSAAPGNYTDTLLLMIEPE